MIDDREPIREGYVCQDCRTPFDTGVGHARSCQACGGSDESRHDELARRRREGTVIRMLGVEITGAEVDQISADGP